MLRLSVAIVLAVAPTMAFAQANTPARPRNDRSTWVTRGDYPRDEYFKGVQGTTVFTLTIDVEGRPTACKVVQSSGSQILDTTTCTVITARAKFDPARDAEGRKIAGSYRNRVHWIIPPEQQAEELKARELSGK